MQKELSLSELRKDGGTQPRDISDSTVADYADDMKRGARFPPVEVFYDGDNYWLVDGFHRVAAIDFRGLKLVNCKIHKGTQEDAQWYSFTVNQGHGSRRTNEDKQRAVQGALVHPKGAELSNAEIARQIGVSISMVADWRKRVKPTYQKLVDASGEPELQGEPILPNRQDSPSQPIENTGTGYKPHATEGESQSEETPARIATRKGRNYRIKTGKIGKHRRPSKTTLSPEKEPDLHPQTQKRNTVTAAVLDFMEHARHLAELAEWLMKETRYDEAEAELQRGLNALQPIIERIEKQAIATDPLNRSRLHIQEKTCP